MRGAEIEITETTGLKPGSPEYWAAVNSRFNQVVDRTQPAFSVLDQAGIALEGRTNPFAKLAGAMFMSQRNQNFTMIRRATREGGTKGLVDLGLVMGAAPAMVVMIDIARSSLYGYNEDEDASDVVYDGLWRLVETNLSNIYGSAAIIEALQPIKQAVMGDVIRYRSRGNGRQMEGH